MDTKYYRSVKTNEVAELVGHNEHGVILLLNNGEERVLASSTLKRWWKEVPLQFDETSPETKIKQEPEKPTLDIHNNFVTSMKAFSEAVGGELFIRPSTGSHNLRIGGKIYLFYKLTKSGVVLYFKSKAVGNEVSYIQVNHNFDAKVVYTEWNTTIYETVRKIHDLSLKYQTSKAKK